MTVDLSTLKVGDSVRFRNKSEALVTDIRGDVDKYIVYFGRNKSSYYYNGVCGYIGSPLDIIDIIEIIPAQKEPEMTKPKYKAGDKLYVLLDAFHASQLNCPNHQCGISERDIISVEPARKPAFAYFGISEITGGIVYLGADPSGADFTITYNPNLPKGQRASVEEV